MSRGAQAGPAQVMAGRLVSASLDTPIRLEPAIAG